MSGRTAMVAVRRRGVWVGNSKSNGSPGMLLVGCRAAGAVTSLGGDATAERCLAQDGFSPRAVDLHLDDVLDVRGQRDRGRDPVFRQAAEALDRQSLEQ